MAGSRAGRTCNLPAVSIVSKLYSTSTLDYHRNIEIDRGRKGNDSTQTFLVRGEESQVATCTIHGYTRYLIFNRKQKVASEKGASA